MVVQPGCSADEHLLQRSLRDVVGDEGLADVAQQYKSKPAFVTLLVAMPSPRSVRRHASRSARLWRGRRGRPGIRPAVSEARRRESSLLGESGRGDESKADCLSMRECFAPHLFERVRKGVPEV
jgi:hypothetical protein